MGHSRSWLAAALALFAGTAMAQDLDNGQRLARRWCVECHDVGANTGKATHVISFAAIAQRPGITPQMIASFLLMPHATMPNLPLTGKDAQDIAAFIMQMKN